MPSRSRSLAPRLVVSPRGGPLCVASSVLATRMGWQGAVCGRLQADSYEERERMNPGFLKNACTPTQR
mgnify:CR=1 FL=1